MKLPASISRKWARRLYNFVVRRQHVCYTGTHQLQKLLKRRAAMKTFGPLDIFSEFRCQLAWDEVVPPEVPILVVDGNVPSAFVTRSDCRTPLSRRGFGETSFWLARPLPKKSASIIRKITTVEGERHKWACRFEPEEAGDCMVWRTCDGEWLEDGDIASFQL